MTVSSTQSRKTFAGNGSTTSFDTSPIVFFDTSDLLVYAVTDSTGASELLVENTDYTATGGSGSTGTISTAGGSSPYGAPASGITLVIDRQVAATQESDFVNNDASDAEVVEDALDRLTMLAQQNANGLTRAVTLASSDVSGANPELPTPVADGYWKWNAAGTALEFVDIGTLSASGATVSAYMQTVLDDATEAAARTTLGIEGKTTVASASSPDIWTATHMLIDYTGTTTATGFAAAPQAGARRTLLCAGAAPFTAGANMLIDGVPSGSTYTAAAGDQIEVVAVTATQFRLRITRQFLQVGTGAIARTNQDKAREGYYSVKDFGAVGNGSTDDSTAIQAAIDAVVAAAGGGTVYFPSGSYKITTTINVTSGSVRLLGDHVGSASILSTGTTGTMILLTGNRHSIENLLIYRNTHSTNSNSIVVSIVNGVQCKLDNCWLQGGYHCLSITGTACTDNIITRCNFTFATGSAMVILQSASGTHGGHHFYRCLMNQSYPVSTPTSTKYKGARANTTAYVAGDIVSIGSYYVQCSVGGTSSGSAPSLAFYGTNITDGTVTWLLMGHTSYRGIQFDTNVNYCVLAECDLTGPFLNAVDITDTLTGTDPYAITVRDCTAHGPITNGLSISAGQEHIIDGFNTFNATGTGTTIGIAAGGLGDVLIKNCQTYGFTTGIAITNASQVGTNVIGNHSAGNTNGIRVAANVSYFSIVGNWVGSSVSRGANTNSIVVAAGTSDRYVITNNTIAAIAVSDGGGGANKSVTQNF